MKEELIAIEYKDGSASKLNLFYSKDSKDAPLIIIFPAMGVTAAYYKPLAEQLAANNINVITSDLRGNGHSSVKAGRNTDFGYHELVEVDIKGVVEKVSELFPNQRKYILGHSLGGQLASLYLGKYNTAPIDGLILVATCSVYYKGWTGSKRMEIILGSYMSRFIAAVLGYFPGNILGFGGKEARGVIRDWARQGLTGKYITARGGHNYEDSLKNLCIPVLAISYLEDSFAPEQAVRNLYNKFGNAANVDHVLLSDGSGHKSKKCHFSWVKNSELVLPHVVRFVK